VHSDRTMRIQPSDGDRYLKVSADVRIEAPQSERGFVLGCNPGTRSEQHLIAIAQACDTCLIGL